MIVSTGLKRIAENRLDEAEEKLPFLNPSLETHFIGKLQSRKIKRIVDLFDVIQSLENLEQARAISDCKKEIDVYLQVNLSGQKQRSGCDPSEVPFLIQEIKKLPYLNLIGVMGMASQSSQLIREEFRTLKALQGDLRECSMGMSSDFSIAIAEGATILRLGTYLFEHGLPDGVQIE